MRMNVPLLLVAVLVAVPAQAANRYYCATDDENIKLSIDIGFEDDAPFRVNHFRGALISKKDSVPAGFRKLVLDYPQLMHDWNYDGELRFNLFAKGTDDEHDSSFSLRVSANAASGSSGMDGRYTLTFVDPGKAPLTFNNKVNCAPK